MVEANKIAEKPDAYNDDKMLLHILRNPHGYTNSDIRKVALSAADRIEHLKDAYENMRDYAIDSGLDVTAHNR